MVEKEGYKTFVWLAGMVFADRNFVAHVDEVGLDAVIAECPLGDDMSDEQKAAFSAAFNQAWLRLVVKLWWIIYDYLRKRGKIPGAATASPWRP
jgi:hypothetical protein